MEGFEIIISQMRKLARKLENPLVEIPSFIEDGRFESGENKNIKRNI